MIMVRIMILSNASSFEVLQVVGFIFLLKSGKQPPGRKYLLIFIRALGT